VADAVAELDRTVRERAGSGAPGSYTVELLADRNLRLKKLGEEAAELVTACADGEPARATAEAADLIYHALVALRALGVGWDDVRRALAARRVVR
jgi:phosphoribosyl-ATP pyrophosphohydrolase/phosphoribosyl-AMP cyclohydrolase